MDEEYMDWIYASVMGNLVPGYECQKVENLFETGKPCANLYRDAIEAYWRLCERLGVDEDGDGEIIINSLLNITRRVAFQMFECGADPEIGHPHKGTGEP